MHLDGCEFDDWRDWWARFRQTNGLCLRAAGSNQRIRMRFFSGTAATRGQNVKDKVEILSRSKTLLRPTVAFSSFFWSQVTVMHLQRPASNYSTWKNPQIRSEFITCFHPNWSHILDYHYFNRDGKGTPSLSLCLSIVTETLPWREVRVADQRRMGETTCGHNTGWPIVYICLYHIMCEHEIEISAFMQLNNLWSLTAVKSATPIAILSAHLLRMESTMPKPFTSATAGLEHLPCLCSTFFPPRFTIGL